jgi:predicted SAM-dependent methyltransferase
MTPLVFIHYGCHHCAPTEWLNYDASPTLRLERLPILGRLIRKNSSRFPRNVVYGDIVHGLPVEEASCDGVYCSHVLEHLAFEDCRRALINTHRMMKKNAVFRMVLPDLEHYIKSYTMSANNEHRAKEFMIKTSLGQIKRHAGIYSLIIESFGNSSHRWMWDYDSLNYELSQIGFRNIRRALYGDSNNPMFDLVEQKDRWECALGVECQK